MNRTLFTVISIEVLVLSSVSLGYTGGSGTPEAPYQIASKADLLALAATAEDYNKCFVLTADINMEGQVFTTAIIAPNIGSNHGFLGTAFTGTFDGSSYKITNFTINSGNNDYLGLFGYAGSIGLVKNLGIEDCTVSGLSDSYFVGGLMGMNLGNITNCYSTGFVSGTKGVGGLVGYNNSDSFFYPASIIDCHSTGAVNGTVDVGGLTGESNGDITNCYSTGNVTCGDCYAGGLCGDSHGRSSITNCYSTGNVAGGDNYTGGLVGFTDASIIDCHSTGAVSGTSGVGGLVGCIDFGSISNCCSTGTVSCTNYYAGGLVGYNNYGSISNCYSTGTVSGDIDSYDLGGLAGENWGNITNCSSTGSVIGTTCVGGLVGNNYEGTILNSNSTGSVSGYDCTGGLVGHYEDGSVSDCYSTGSVSGTSCVGGLMGRSSNCTISNCYSTGSVIGVTYTGGLVGEGDLISNCYSTSSVVGTTCVGGLAGSGCSISNCYSTGNVNGTSNSNYVGGLVGSGNYISNCYSAGAVSGTYNVGGLVGISDVSVTNCYFLVTGGPDNGYGQPLTDEQMKQQDSFIGWDFIEIWNIGENQTYPFLREYLPSDINMDGQTNFFDLAILAQHWLQQD